MNLTALVAGAGMWAYALIFLLTAGETSAFVGLVLPSETVVLFAAALSSRGVLNPFLLALVVIAGGIVGDNTGYWLGRLFGKRVDAPCRRRRIKPGGRIDRAAGYLRRRGGPAVFTGRFIGFVRSFVPFTAGAARMPYRSFLGYSAAASLTWGPLNVAAGYFLGASAAGLLRTVGLAGLIAVGVAALVLAGALAWRQRRRRARAAPEPPTEPATSTAPRDEPATSSAPRDEPITPTAAGAEPATEPAEAPAAPAEPSKEPTAPTEPLAGPAAPAKPRAPREPQDAPGPTRPLAGHGSPHRRT
ncbi:membrane-associated protein [Kitasatospora sp. GP30]|uniref:DedA family protein n=1 Tax=Kitasatospora sp. GP30 TaxID=3035084 RepID=UPI000C711A02|nr:DedA family protein [Kitasatospora sp. GP30]MDH6140242.1 membrane-associated protein [Kitasatospora sp. GP30]